jgi:hypothetical protein
LKEEIEIPTFFATLMKEDSKLIKFDFQHKKIFYVVMKNFLSILKKYEKKRFVICFP